MVAWVLLEVSVLRQRLANKPRDQKIFIGRALLFIFALQIVVITSLPVLFWAFLFSYAIWSQEYPLLKRWITEKKYRQLTIGGLRQVSTVCKCIYRSTRLLAVVFKAALFFALLYPLGIALPVMLQFIFLHPTILWVPYSLCTLVFVYQVWHRWYPALKQKLGPTGMGYVYALLVMTTSGWAFVLARLYINTLTGVDPSNFPKALTTLATFAVVPASIFIIAMAAALICVGYLVAAGFAMLWYEIQTLWQQVRLISGLPLAQKKVLPGVDRIFMKVFGAFGVFAFCSLLVAGEVSPVNRVVHFIAAYTLVATEFSYDHTCAVSSQKRLVARLNNFSESKPPKVLIAESRPWGDVNFSIGTCE